LSDCIRKKQTTGELGLTKKKQKDSIIAQNHSFSWAGAQRAITVTKAGWYLLSMSWGRQVAILAVWHGTTVAERWYIISRQRWWCCQSQWLELWQCCWIFA